MLTILPPRTHPPPVLYSNGTHDFHNTVILVSFDGFRSDYLDRNFTPNIQKFSKIFFFFNFVKKFI